VAYREFFAMRETLDGESREVIEQEIQAEKAASRLAGERSRKDLNRASFRAAVWFESWPIGLSFLGDGSGCLVPGGVGCGRGLRRGGGR
jgi:hypothetical protein